MDAEEIKSHAKRRASAYRDLADSLDMNDVSRKIARTKGRRQNRQIADESGYSAYSCA